MAEKRIFRIEDIINKIRTKIIKEEKIPALEI